MPWKIGEEMVGGRLRPLRTEPRDAVCFLEYAAAYWERGHPVR
jgi:hypothetical protein